MNLGRRGRDLFVFNHELRASYTHIDSTPEEQMEAIGNVLRHRVAWLDRP